MNNKFVSQHSDHRYPRNANGLVIMPGVEVKYATITYEGTLLDIARTGIKIHTGIITQIASDHYVLISGVAKPVHQEDLYPETVSTQQIKNTIIDNLHRQNTSGKDK